MIRIRDSAHGVIIAAIFTACHGSNQSDSQKNAPPSPSAAPSAAPEVADDRPGRCSVKGDKPTPLGTITGDVFGFDGDATALYYSSWEIYGQRGDVGAIRKDGGGSSKLTSLDLEPRGLALDDTTVFYTSGIRLMSIPKSGGESKTIAPQFSAQYIASHGADVYGVPGDYGPYDRVARVPKKGGDTKELSSEKRPKTNLPPNGFSRILVDDSGAFVTDSGNNRVLRFPLEGGKPKVVAAKQEKAFDMALVGSDVYFALARSGDLLLVPKSGGTAKKLGSGLVENARIAADDRALYTVIAGKDAPGAVVKLVPSASEVTKVADVPPSTTVSQIALDADCAYWVVRETSAKSVVYALHR
jgi:hypothetical protein